MMNDDAIFRNTLELIETHINEAGNPFYSVSMGELTFVAEVEKMLFSSVFSSMPLFSSTFWPVVRKRGIRKLEKLENRLEIYRSNLDDLSPKSVRILKALMSIRTIKEEQSRNV